MSGMMLNFAGVSAASVPGAPTIGTATATSNTTATVTYTAPASDGGATITQYAAYDNNGVFKGIVYQAGSGTINLTGLTATTNYSFRVYARNSVGEGPPSSFSNTITTLAAPGQQLYESAQACYTWVAPAGVTSVSVITIAVGGAGNRSGYLYCCGCYYYGGGGGGGGGLAYKNNIAVTPGNSYAVAITGSGYTLFNTSGTVSATNGVNSGYWFGGAGGAGVAGDVLRTGGTGGNGYNLNQIGGGGGGAAGYAGTGGNGGRGNVAESFAGSGGGGGGGAGAYSAGRAGAGGGGTGALGQGSSGAAGNIPTVCSPVAGGGGAGSSQCGASTAGASPTTQVSGAGGKYGGGSGGSSGGNVTDGAKSFGAVRIIWPGTCRQFPSTRTGNE